MAVKKTSKAKQVVGGIAVALALILAGGVVGGLLQHHYKWGEDDPKIEDSTGGEEKPEDSSGGGEVNTEAGVSHGIKLAATKLLSTEYEDYGVSPMAETAYTLTATITPADAANKKVDWTIAFKNASSSWATGKTVTDYATVTPSADGALTAVVENLEAFGEQIVVKATSRDNTNAYATCAVEYLQRTEGYNFCMVPEQGPPAFQIGFGFGGSDEGTVKPDFSKTNMLRPQLIAMKNPVYTRENTDKVTYYTLKPTAGFKLAAVGPEGTGLFEASGSTVDGAFCAAIDFFGSGFNLYKTDPVKMNNFINIIDTYKAGVFYEITLYTEEGGTQVAKFNIMLDASIIKGQKRVESIVVDETEIVF